MFFCVFTVTKRMCGLALLIKGLECLPSDVCLSSISQGINIPHKMKHWQEFILAVAHCCWIIDIYIYIYI